MFPRVTFTSKDKDPDTSYKIHTLDTLQNYFITTFVVTISNKKGHIFLQMQPNLRQEILLP